MKQIARVALTLYAVLLASCILALMIGRQQTVTGSTQPSDIERCNQELCFRGIIPGVTPWTEVLTRFTTVVDRQNDPFTIHINIDSDREVVLFRSADQRTVECVAMVGYNGKPLSLLSTLIAQYGAPSEVRLHLNPPPSPNQMVLRYPFLTARIFFYLSTERLTLEAPVGFVELTNPANWASEDYINPCRDSIRKQTDIATNWHGFTRLANYMVRRE